jgi:hypothetical protein
MDDFENPLDLDGDGDDAIEMCLLFDEDGKKEGGGHQPAGNGGCCIILLAFGSAVSAVTYGVVNFII